MEKVYMICSFCLKQFSSEIGVRNRSDDDNLLLKRFLEVTERYLGRCFLSSEELAKGIKTCQDCVFLIQEFCNVYHEWKCLKLELEWKLGKLKNVMSSADKVRSRRETFKKMMGDDDAIGLGGVGFYRIISSFRKDFQLQCRGHFSNPFPRVTLKRLQHSPVQLKVENAVEEPTLNTVAMPSGDNCHWFLGWLSTFAVVLFLLGDISTMSEHLTLEICDDENFEDFEESTAEPIQPKYYADETPCSEECNLSSSSQPIRNELPIRQKIRRMKKKLLAKTKQKLYFCSYCQRKFTGLERFQKHRRAFTHLLTKKNVLLSLQKLQLKLKNRMSSHKPLPISTDMELKKIEKFENCENVGLLRPRQRAKRPFVESSSDEEGPASEYDENNGELSSSESSSSTSSGSSVSSFNQQEKFICNLDSCSKSFQFEEELKRHNKYHGFFFCQFCDFTSNYAPSLGLHELTHAMEMKREAGALILNEYNKLKNKKLFCARCNYSVFGEYNYVNHYLVNHFNLPNQQRMCEICKKWLSKSSVEPHMKAIHGPKKNERKKKTYKPKKNKNKPWGCEVETCPESFDYKEELEIHKKRHGQFKCNFCNVIETFAPELATHELTHSKRKNKTNEWNCSRCSYTSVVRLCFINHFLKQHLEVPLQRIMCNICKKLVLHSTMRTHLRRCQNRAATVKVPKSLTSDTKKCNVVPKRTRERTTTPTRMGEFPCSSCNVVVTHARELALHDALSHGEQPKTSGHKKLFTCPKCGIKSPTQFQYINHYLQVHMGLEALGKECLNCRSRVEDATLLKAHLKTYHNFEGMRSEDIVKCNLCPATFGKPLYLILHKKRMHGQVEDSTTCEDCGKKFPTPSQLRMHRIHKHKKKEVDFPLGCDVSGCERRFEKTIDLEWHKQVVHNSKSTEDGNLICEECGKKCQGKSALLKHSRVHTSNKDEDSCRFICEECGNVFSNKHNFQQHQLHHSGPASWKFACLFCDKKSATQGILYTHLRTHTNERPYICEICGEECTQTRHLRSHNNRVHNANEKPKKFEYKISCVSRKGKKLGTYLSADNK